MTPETCDVYSADGHPISGTVISGIARTLDTDPFDLRPLHDAVDPDALDALFATRRERSVGGRNYVRFTSNGCRVLVTRDGEVRVRRART
ncbi:HalOD1 output domain-containing protein [Halomarina litorea]|uniref:HalOD1 output domain-containing protein n=1 Tax=Halomarina litorea TaxID=2961595 RepID=UPI0020C345B3|nr:HalOD1 output domain-containing protein [Halomarina sp. BCD28]